MNAPYRMGQDCFGRLAPPGALDSMEAILKQVDYAGYFVVM